MKSLNVAVVGGGSWGTTIASIVSKNQETTLWARDENIVNDINLNHKNSKYLDNLTLNIKLKSSFSLQKTLVGADVVILGLPSQVCRNVLNEAKAFINPGVPIINLAKGLEIGTCLRMTEVIQSILPSNPVGVLTGPNLAKEILQGHAAAAVLAMVDNRISGSLQQLFHGGLFRVYTNEDVIGCEIAGALKNVIAIAAGMGDGVGAGDNTKAAIITRGLAELTRLGVAMGGKPSTFSGLAGMGDLIATCNSQLSRNRSVGFQLGQGRKIEKIIDDMKMVAEGVKTCSVVLELAKKYNINMPISNEVYKVLNEGLTVKEAFKGLLRIETGAESDPG